MELEKKDEMRKKIVNIYSRYISGEISDDVFVVDVKEIMNSYGRVGYVFMWIAEIFNDIYNSDDSNYTGDLMRLLSRIDKSLPYYWNYQKTKYKQTFCS